MTSNATLARLRQAVSQHASEPRRRVPTRELPPIERILRGEWRETEHGAVFLREDWFTLDHQHGRLPLGAPLDASPIGLARLLRAEQVPHPSKLAFFDLETTGIASGTGTYIVLAGIGSYEAGAFRLRQYFLADIAEERAMLAALSADLTECEGLVTFNGRSFDVPLLAGRLALARLPNPTQRMTHFDLLHPVRRLYKHRMPGCRLAEAERRLLRLERHEDIPGSIIPSLYFAYVRAGQAAPLRAVFAHNAEDVLSLAGLLASLAALLADDPSDPEDAVAVARWWERERQPERAAALYERAVPWLKGGEHWEWAAARYASLCRRAGRHQEAAIIWRELSEVGNRAAQLHMAKHLEHRTKEHAAALEAVEGLLQHARGEEEASLRHRAARISAKLIRTAQI